jgi:hypothetical protein
MDSPYVAWHFVIFLDGMNFCQPCVALMPSKIGSNGISVARRKLLYPTSPREAQYSRRL